jgi:filamentous hemagglutinin family protein
MIAALQVWNRWAIAILTVISLPLGLAAQAQITPDGTLGVERSVVTTDRIEGGARRGGNLFHSFGQFNINEGQNLYFANPAGVSNIFSRVTGSDPSRILGTLGVQGAANLFLLNPKGIIFGQNARLDLGGSFFATTAQTIQFGTQGFFSAVEPQTPPLLTVNPSAMLFTQTPIAEISSRSIAPFSVADQRFGLGVPDGQQLTVLGGNVRLDGGGIGGGLHAPEGRVEIGSVGGLGAIALDTQGRLVFPETVDRADVSFTNRAVSRVERNSQGSLAITARDLNIQQSILIAGIDEGVIAPDRPPGDITLKATGAIRIANQSSVRNSTNGTGNAGNINVSGRSLLVDGSEVLTFTNSKGNAGDLIFNVRDSIEFDQGRIGTSLNSPESVGNGGRIVMNTGVLSIKDNTEVFADTQGQGNAGNIFINARGAVSLDDSIIVAYVEANTGRGNAGDINITARSLSLTTGAQLSVSTRFQGNAGNVRIKVEEGVLLDGTTRDGEFPSAIFSSVNPFAVGKGGDIEIMANTLTLSNGGRLRASTRGQGDAGNIRIMARNAVLISGFSRDGQFPSIMLTNVARSGVGNGGNIEITTGAITLRNNGLIQSDSEGQGRAGDIMLKAGIIRLDRGGLFADARQIGGANIKLQDVNLLVLSNGSKISAEAFDNAIGGNVTINAPQGFVIALPNQDSDIIANAVAGRGGNIQITAQGIFGLKVQPLDSAAQSNDIDASSAFNQSGSVILNQLNPNPTQGVTELPNQPRSPQPLANCQSGNTKGDRFISTGRGGLPIHPGEPLSRLTSLDDLALPRNWRTAQTAAIVEAQDLQINSSGQVILVGPQVAQLPCSRSNPK